MGLETESPSYWSEYAHAVKCLLGEPGDEYLARMIDKLCRRQHERPECGAIAQGLRLPVPEME